MLLKITAVFTLVLGLSFVGSAQEKAVSSTYAEMTESTKVDEFENISDEEVSQKMQNFARYLQKNKDTKGFIIHYGDYSESIFRQTIYYKRNKTWELQKYFFQWLENLNVDLIMGGVRQNKRFELWLVPPNGKEPAEKAETELQRDLLYRFDLLESDKLEFQINPQKSTELTNSVYELKNKIDLEDLLRVAGEVLAADDSKRSVLIYYLDDSIANIENLQRVFEQFVGDYAEKNNLKLNRVKIIYGGFRNKSVVESWVIPINEVEPEPMTEEKY